jgi:hypothetical protein
MNTPDSPALDIPGFAAAYGLKESWVRAEVRKGGQLADLHHRIGKHVRFTESDQARFEAQTAATDADEADATASPQDLQKAGLRLMKAQTRQAA